MAVIVQKMICAEVAGVAFTMDPVAGDYSKLVINSNWGLGDSVVSGNVIADRYEIDKNSRELTNSRIVLKSRESHCAKDGGIVQTDVDQDRARNPSLNYDQVQTLSSICLDIAGHFQYPIDIEWALKNREFYILQVRPVTTI
jgi:pyruvate,water dikinase